MCRMLGMPTPTARLFTAALTMLLAPLVAGSVAAAAPTGSASGHDAFYLPPDPRPGGASGDVLRAEPVVAPALDALATRVMYRSENATGGPIAVTGTVFVPSRPWAGDGPRPTVVLGPGTQGMGDQCAPSKLTNHLQEYEYLHIVPLLARGYAVAMTDYEGLGTPGGHPYLNRVSQGHAMLDMARAALRLTDRGIDEGTRIGFWGYSQGGMSSAAAAELADTYAPELPVVAAVAGSPPASLADLAVAGDGSLLSGGIGWVVNGFAAAYPQVREELFGAFNPAGRDILARAETYCVYDAPRMNPFFPTAWYTVDGRPIADHLAAEPWASLVREQELGNIAPTIPTFVAQNATDDFVQVSGVDAMVGKWCAGGTSVTYRRYAVPPVLRGTGAGHGIGLLPAAVEGLDWMDRRFAGAPDEGTCAG